MSATECGAGVYFPSILSQIQDPGTPGPDLPEWKSSGAHEHVGAGAFCRFPSFKSQIKPNEGFKGRIKAESWREESSGTKRSVEAPADVLRSWQQSHGS